MAYNSLLPEKEIENRLRNDLFKEYDSTHVLGNVDFAVAIKSNNCLFEPEYLLWAEAKKGHSANINESFVQLILTIGKARTFDHHLPPIFLGAFDAEKIAFLPYIQVIDVFYQNDFNWNVKPSDHSTKEFRQVFDMVLSILEKEVLTFYFDQDHDELVRFIKTNFVIGKSHLSKIKITKTNFVSIYQKWLVEVKPSISEIDWDKAKSKGILYADFFLADILSEHNSTLKEKLFVLLRQDHYELDMKVDECGITNLLRAEFNDEQKAHNHFWSKYERPPKREYWDYIVERRDLLVPQDVRERKGSFFTPQKWVELSQQYLSDELGENWQDEYYIWDCAAGTGNLLNGLTNKYRIWASTLDKADVDVMKERIKNGANLLDSHVFQFDFLNDSFDNLPDGLKEILNSEDKRKKLVIYINPPYAEAATTRQKTGTGSNKKDVAKNNYIKNRYQQRLGGAINELYAQFLIRAYYEIPHSVLANFSTLKNLQAPNFKDFRLNFQAELRRIFLVPADTFDNVSGSFPIGFYIWDTSVRKNFSSISADIYDRNGTFFVKKRLFAPVPEQLLMDWLRRAYDKINPRIAYLRMLGSDIQNNNGVFITNTPSASDLKQRKTCDITARNLLHVCVYFAVRHAIHATWINDRDQYNSPIPSYSRDHLFISDCLIFTIFNGQNRINEKGGINNWIPFTEDEVGAKDCFKSHFMSDFIKGKLRNGQSSLFGDQTSPFVFSPEANDVITAGRKLWAYYHSQPKANPDASLYDIKMYFQGTKTIKSGKIQMNNESQDKKYMELIGILREKLRLLASRIEPKIYEYGFLRK